MKNFTTVILVLLISASVLFGIEQLIYGTFTYKWYLSGELIEDSDYVNGRYYQVNDSIRITQENTCVGLKYKVMVKEDDSYKYSGTSIFESVCGWKYSALRFVQYRYEDALDEQIKMASIEVRIESVKLMNTSSVIDSLNLVFDQAHVSFNHSDASFNEAKKVDDYTSMLQYNDSCKLFANRMRKTLSKIKILRHSIK